MTLVVGDEGIDALKIDRRGNVGGVEGPQRRLGQRSGGLEQRPVEWPQRDRIEQLAEAVDEIGRASGRALSYVPVTIDDYAAELVKYEVPEDIIGLLRHLFTETLDGRNSELADGVQQALGRAPRDFADYAREIAATGIWDV